MRQHLPLGMGAAGVPDRHRGTGHPAPPRRKGRNNPAHLHPACDSCGGTENHIKRRKQEPDAAEQHPGFTANSLRVTVISRPCKATVRERRSMTRSPYCSEGMFCIMACPSSHMCNIGPALCELITGASCSVPSLSRKQYLQSSQLDICHEK